jgi:two-component system nitrogen regulation sensor histidine kinase GlnL
MDKEFIESLNALHKNITSVKEISDVEQNVEEFLNKYLNYTSYGLYTLTKENKLKYISGKNWKIEKNETFEVSDDYIAGWVTKQKKELTIENMDKDERKIEGNSKIKSVYAIPLFSDGKIIGVIIFGSQRKRHWKEPELTVIRSFTQALINAMHFINHFQAVRKFSSEIESLNQFFSSIVNNFPSGIITIDKEGNITLINRKAKKIINIDSNTTNNQNIKSLDNYKYALINPLLDTIKENKALTRMETDIIQSNGNKIPIGFSTSPLWDKSGNVIGSIAIMKELTEIKQLEEHLRRKDRLAALGEMAAGMAHEIRNPLAGIRTGVEYLGRFLDEKNRDYVKLITKEISRLNRIVTDMTLYANRPPIKLEKVNLEKIIDISLAFLKHNIEEKKVNVSKDYDNNLPPINLDGDQMREIFDNLFLNALQAVKNGGKIKISTNYQKEKNYIEVEIKDNGNGISEKNKERIFNPFFTTKKGGTGLGLPICHRIISEHNGNIVITSKQGEGTTACIKLPLNEEIESSKNESNKKN